MKPRRQRFLLLLLFLLALGGEALHTLSAHHDASHCSVCTMQANDIGTDLHAENAPSALFVIHETPQRRTGLSVPVLAAPTLFGRAPPLLPS